jgi:hypothetical protein
MLRAILTPHTVLKLACRLHTVLMIYFLDLEVSQE